MKTQIEKLTCIKQTTGVDAFFFTSPVSVKYFSGFFFYFEHGPSPFHVMPAALIAVPGNSACLLAADNEIQQVPNIYGGISLKTYSSYVYGRPPDYTGKFLHQVRTIIKEQKLEKACFGVEANSFPVVIEHYLHDRFPQMKFKDISREIYALRAIKTRNEIAMIRKAAALCDTGQAAVVKFARPGITELELFNLVRTEIETAAGTRVPLMADFISGAATSSGGGLPTNKVIKQGDLILSDLTPCLNGYWGDSCNTIVMGDPTPGQRGIFALVKQALEIGIAAVRPGVKACEIDRLMRAHIGNYPHHSGHGVGVAYHEEPRIVRYNQTELAPGMVIALEPAIYEEGNGIRLEHLVAVTETGCELLTNFQHCFEQCMQPA